jgi:hypothetical protein
LFKTIHIICSDVEAKSLNLNNKRFVVPVDLETGENVAFTGTQLRQAKYAWYDGSTLKQVLQSGDAMTMPTLTRVATIASASNNVVPLRFATFRSFALLHEDCRAVEERQPLYDQGARTSVYRLIGVSLLSL